jgi:hypothetical protein
MRDCDHMQRHLFVHTKRDGQAVDSVPVCDPFHTTRIVCEWTLWEWLKMLFARSTTIEVRVDADGVAMKRWFLGQDTCERCKQTKIGPMPGAHETEPGYHHGKERWCEACYYRDPIPNSRTETACCNARPPTP